MGARYELSANTTTFDQCSGRSLSYDFFNHVQCIHLISVALSCPIDWSLIREFIIPKKVKWNTTNGWREEEKVQSWQSCSKSDWTSYFALARKCIFNLALGSLNLSLGKIRVWCLFVDSCCISVNVSKRPNFLHFSRFLSAKATISFIIEIINIFILFWCWKIKTIIHLIQICFLSKEILFANTFQSVCDFILNFYNFAKILKSTQWKEKKEVWILIGLY